MKRDMRERRGAGFWDGDTEKAELDRKLDELVQKSAAKAGERVAKAVAQRLSQQSKLPESA